jgi:hypothetical protein
LRQLDRWKAITNKLKLRFGLKPRKWTIVAFNVERKTLRHHHMRPWISRG